MTEPKHDIGFPEALQRMSRIIRSGQSRSIILTGNIGDLYFNPTASGGKGDYVPFVDRLVGILAAKGSRIVLTYRLNGPIEFASNEERSAIRDLWVRAHFEGFDPSRTDAWLDDKTSARAGELRKKFDGLMKEALGAPAVAFELLRQLCLHARQVRERDGSRVLKEHLRIIVESADVHIPEVEVSRMTDADRRRMGICQDWISDPGFQRGDDVVLLLAESRGALNSRIARLPQLLGVELPAPDEAPLHRLVQRTSSRRREEGRHGR
jgi:hypothetical protein